MRLTVLKALLWLVCVTHVGMGLAGVSSAGMALEAARIFYGAQVEATPAMIHVLRILGAYMIAMGILGGVAASNPVKYRWIIVVIAVLLLIRVLQRVVHAGEIHATFGISEMRIWGQAAYFAVLAGLLIFLLPRQKSRA